MRSRMNLTGSGAQPLLSSVTIMGSKRRTRRPLVCSSHDPAAKTFFTQVALCSVGKGDDVPAVSAKGVDGGAVRAARLSTDVAHYSEPR
jgi:hypothetical protein